MRKCPYCEHEQESCESEFICESCGRRIVRNIYTPCEGDEFSYLGGTIIKHENHHL